MTVHIITVVYILGAFLLAYWELDNYFRPPAYYKIIEHPPKIVHAGEIVTAVAEIYRRKECVVFSERVFTNLDSEHQFVTRTNNQLLGAQGKSKNKFEIEIPKNIEKGPTVLQGRFKYYCNPSDYLFSPTIVLGEPMFFTIVE